MCGKPTAEVYINLEEADFTPRNAIAILSDAFLNRKRLNRTNDLRQPAKERPFCALVD
jgi:hypothetical protein